MAPNSLSTENKSQNKQERCGNPHRQLCDGGGSKGTHPMQIKGTTCGTSDSRYFLNIAERHQKGRDVTTRKYFTLGIFAICRQAFSWMPLRNSSIFHSFIHSVIKKSDTEYLSQRFHSLSLKFKSNGAMFPMRVKVIQVHIITERPCSFSDSFPLWVIAGY